MVRSAAPLAALLLGACSPGSAEDGEAQALMDRIEKEVRLPERAGPLQDYGRYYAEESDGTIIGVYIVPVDDEPVPGESCEEVLPDLTTREVPCDPTATPWELPAGKRRWFKDPRELPFICDGGCSQVTVTFDKARGAVTDARCNGST